MNSRPGLANMISANMNKKIPIDNYLSIRVCTASTADVDLSNDGD